MGWKGGGKAGPEGSLTAGGQGPAIVCIRSLFPQPPAGSPPGGQL